MKIKNLAILACLSSTLLLSTACASLRAIIPGGVSASDAEWTGVKSGPTISIVGSLDSRVAVLAALAQTLGQDDPIGVLLPVTAVGETSPRWIICSDKLAATCNSIPLNAQVHFAGQPIGPGILWRPSRIRFED